MFCEGEHRINLVPVSFKGDYLQSMGYRMSRSILKQIQQVYSIICNASKSIHYTSFPKSPLKGELSKAFMGLR